MNSKKNLPFSKRLGFALCGLREALRSEKSLRFHAVALVGVVVTLCIVRPGPVWWALAALACSIVITAELINTALEHLIDHLHPAEHPRIGIVKDLGAAAVLVSVIGALAIAAAFAVHLFGRFFT